MPRKSVLLLFVIALPFGAMASPWSETPSNLDRLEKALRDRDYSAALDLTQSLEFPAEEADLVEWLRIKAFMGLNRWEDALEACDTFIREYPGSQWQVKAHYRKAECLAALGRFAEAERIYSRGAMATLDNSRRQEIARIYIRLADRFYEPKLREPKPGDPVEAPDFGKALNLYEKAAAIVSSGTTSERLRFQIVQCRWKLGSLDGAIQDAQALLGDYREGKIEPLEVVAPDAPGIPNPYEAGGYFDRIWLDLAKIHLQKGDHPMARRTLSEFIEVRSGVTNQPEYVAEAAFHLAKTFNLPNPPEANALNRGVTCLLNFIERFPEDKRVPEAALTIGDSYFNRGEFEKAMEAYRQFLSLHSEKAERDQRAHAEMRVGESQRRLGQYEEAISTWTLFLTRFPVDIRWQEVQSSIVNTRYLQAEAAFGEAERRIGLLEGKDEPVPAQALESLSRAQALWIQFADLYPLDPRVPRILFLMGEIEFLRRDYDAAIRAWEDLAARYPRNSEAGQALFRIGQIYETQRNEPARAIETWEKITQGEWQARAQARIRELREPSLWVRTERIYRGDEEAKVHLTVRNIETLTVKAFHLELETYFRRHHTIRRVEDLDISLVAPDKVWSVTVENYAQYRSHEHEVKIPFQDPGAYVIQISSETHQALTLVLRSDIEAVMKSSRDNAFVYVENAPKDEAAPGTKVFISDGSKIVAEGVTGEDGVLRTGFERGEAAELVFFAFQGNHFASNALGIGGLSVAQPISPRGFLYTDRPAYQPGAEVSFRLLLRETSGTAYSIPSGIAYRVQVFTADNQVLYDEEKEIGPFGTANGSLKLPATARYGQYRIVASREDGPTFSGNFRVEQYRVPRFRIEIDTEKTTYFHGEEIGGSLTVQTFFGEALPGERIRYRLVGPAAGVWEEGTVNEQGKIEFSFPTWDQPEEALLTIQAQLVREQNMFDKRVLLVNTAYRIEMELNRTTFLAGERFAVRVRALTHGEKPSGVAVPLTLISEKRSREGGWTNVAFQEFSTSDVLETWTEVPVRYESGGTYRLRIEGKDKAGNLVTAERIVQISGEEDLNRLLILSDRSRFHLEEMPELKVVWRNETQRALLTAETESVVEYRFVTLQKGENTIEWPLSSKLSPAFYFTVSVVDGARFHAASQFLAVVERMEVTVTPDRKEYSPGDTVTLTIETRDQDGNPLVSECSVAAVDQALYALFPDPIANFGELFRQQWQGNYVATGSSCGFSYEGPTREISEAILEERQWVRLQEERRGGLPGTSGIPLVFFESADFFPSLDPAIAEDYRPRRESERLDRRIAVDEISGGRGIYSWEESPGAIFKQAQMYDGDGRVALISIDGYWRSDLLSASAISNLPSSITVGYEGRTDPRAIVLRNYFPETAYWNPGIVLDEAGKGTLTFTLPDNATTWRLVVRGITVDTHLGEGEADIVVKKPLLVDVDAPGEVMEGDKLSIFAEVRNLTGTSSEIAWDFRADLTERIAVRSGRIGLATGERFQESISLEPSEIGSRTLRIEARSGEHSDAVERKIEVIADSVPIRVGESGTARDDVRKTFSLPKEIDYSALRMTVSISPSLDRSLLHFREIGVIGNTFACMPAPPNDATLASGIRGLAVLRYLKETGTEEGAMRHEAESALRGAIDYLNAAQRDDGGWAWSGVGPRAGSDTFTTALALDLLAGARQMGYRVNPQIMEKAANRLNEIFTKSSDNHEKTVCLFGLAGVGRADFAHLNRLQRLVEYLNEFDLAILANVWVGLDRNEKAAELLVPLIARGVFEEAWNPRSLNPDNSERWSVHVDARVETRALALYALVQARDRVPGSRDTIEKAVEALSGTRGFYWGPVRGKALAVRALARYLTTVPRSEDNYTLAISVNGQSVKTLEVRGAPSAQTFAVDPSLLKTQGNEIVMDLEGRGQFLYTIVLEGDTRGISSRQTELLADGPLFYHASKSYTHGPLLYAGQEIPRGYSVLEGRYQNVSNNLREIPAGELINVRIEFTSREREGFLAIEESIPAGFILEPNSVNGNIEYFESAPGRLILYTGSGSDRHYWVAYRLRARYPGAYRPRPALIYPVYDPFKLNLAMGSELIVLPEGQSPAQPYRMTPDEKYHLGTKYFADGKYEECRELLHSLFTEFERNLRNEPYTRIAEMLLYVALEQGTPSEIVKYFELLKERNPSHSLFFEQIAKIGDAYRKLEEYERAMHVFRSLLAFLFEQETGVVGDLRNVGENLESIRVMRRLISEYPDLSSVQEALFALASTIYTNTEAWAKSRDFRNAGLTERNLWSEAAYLMGRYLTLYPENPVADQASFSLANLYLDHREWENVAAMTRVFQERFPNSPYLDKFQYLRAYSLFQLREYEEALELLGKLASERYRLFDGGTGYSQDRYNAIHMAGKIFHARGEIEGAMKKYQEVRDHFSDAQLAVTLFRDTGLQIPEVTTVKPGEPAILKTRYKNVARLELRAYRVDLLTLYLHERDLTRITEVNLAGIKPSFDPITVELGTGEDYAWKTREIELPLERTGAYLIMIKGVFAADRPGQIDLSAMLLRTDLELEVQTSQATGLVRANLQTADGDRVADADVRIIGSNEARFNAGKTDMRGIFEVTGVQGTPSVVVRKDDRFAFFRTRQELIPEQPPAQEVQVRAMDGDALFNILSQFSADNTAQRMNYDAFMGTTSKGDIVRVGP